MGRGDISHNMQKDRGDILQNMPDDRSDISHNMQEDRGVISHNMQNQGSGWKANTLCIKKKANIFDIYIVRTSCQS